MFDTKTITHEHDRIDDINEINKEVEFLGKTVLKVDFQALLEEYTTRMSQTDRYEYQHNPVYIKKVDEFTVEYTEEFEPYSVVPKNIRKGKLSKALALLKLPNELVKEIMTTLKNGTKEYSLWKTNNFYNHYRQMDKAGICKSCMSKTPSNYSVRLDTANGMVNFNPLIAYEVDPGWSLYLLKDESKEGYNYIGRSVVYEDELYTASYGRNRTMSTVLGSMEEELGISEYSCEVLKLTAIEAKSGYVLPYSDMAQNAHCEGDFLSLDEGGDIQTDYNTGVGIVGWYCECCEEHHTEDEYAYEYQGAAYCGEAIGNYFQLVDGETYSTEEAVYIESSGDYVHEDQAVWIEDREEHIHVDDAVYVESKAEYFHSDDVHYVDHREEYVHNDDLIEDMNGVMQHTDDCSTYDNGDVVLTIDYNEDNNKT